MKRMFALLKTWAQKLRKYISPVFLALVAVSFTLWYISKLNYTYTTDFKVEVNVDGEKIDVPCLVEGKGSTLFGYGFYSSSRVNVSLGDLQYEVIDVPLPGQTCPDSLLVTEKKVRISPTAMQEALSVRFSDLKIVSVGNFSDINPPKK